jgi:hypothetical protein
MGYNVPCTSESDLVDKNFEAVKAYCLDLEEVVFHDVQCHFAHIPNGIVERYTSSTRTLIHLGVLTNTASGFYRSTTPNCYRCFTNLQGSALTRLPVLSAWI